MRADREPLTVQILRVVGSCPGITAVQLATRIGRSRCSVETRLYTLTVAGVIRRDHADEIAWQYYIEERRALQA